MNIYYDENMPFAREFFADLGTLTAFSGRTLTTAEVSKADVLLVRSITQVNERLLAENKQLSFTGTATIGVDHIDQSYLAMRNINFHSAPGCNAISVAEYVLSALVILAERHLLDLTNMTVGIVGAGNTGSQLSEKLKALNIKYLLCDPLLAESEADSRVFSSLDQVLACDIVSLHVPLTHDGEHKTYHLLDTERLAKLSEQQILINACRGEVVDNQALLKIKTAGHELKVVLDVWEKEPNILHELIPYCEIATAHIAGYSLEGKARGTEILYQALCQHLDILVEKRLTDFLPAPSVEYVEVSQPFDDTLLNQLVKVVYDVQRDDAIFRKKINTHGFDYIRKTYPTRREFSSLTINTSHALSLSTLHKLGFNKILGKER